MAREAIVNGGFDQGSFGWTGFDLETSFAEGAYVGNGSSNRVAELDGNSNAVTVMEQSITVKAPTQTTLTFDTLLRNASAPQAGSEGFRVDIIDPNGQVILTQTFLPTTNQWTPQSLPVSLPAGGTYTVRFTEVGLDDSLGAIIDDVSMMVCFVAGTLIDTDRGPRPVEALAAGDRVLTEDAGPLPVLWTGARTVSVAEQVADPRLRPVEIGQDAFGPGLPARPLSVSQQHRLCLAGWKVELHFGASEALVAAKACVNGRDVRLGAPVRPVTYVHFLLDGHQIVRSNGLPTESFFPSVFSLGAVEAVARSELLRLFPTLSVLTRRFPATARTVIQPAQARLVA